MKDSRVKFAVCVALLTIGVALMLTGINWLLFLGLACILLSSSFSHHQSQKKSGRHIGLFLCLVGIVMDFAYNWRDGNIFKRDPREIWFWVLLIGAWLYGVIEEFRCWRLSESITNVA